ncbi:MAG: hypothetical protein BWY43_00721 [candidate division WS2 bacterium ADurb.Bin280]|uniref:Transcriptional repressor PaaX-like central Cas2-like domain-containing protein n=1 Tax=candidate division WS2 bacterium ADurb.Bin280 TaxID=1852829 RepID=A0A1V5SBU0_9BACT|nr:MAG: hypothetical protein BWY43_00721 [candidate division WS2 bacterium ADurb.Bin280]
MNDLLSPLYKFIVFLEDRRKVDESEISYKTDKTTRGVIGKLDAMKFLKREGTQISLSDLGYEFLNSILSSLHKSTEHWDGKWRIVYFSTPESQRSKRDKFRRELEIMGFRPIIKGLWFSPLPLIEAAQIAQKKCQMTDMAVMIETSIVQGISDEMIEKAWDFDKSRKLFNEFINLSQRLLENKETQKTQVKQLIFHFALILAGEPRLPIELLPKDWPKYRAVLMYKRLKNLIKV